MNQHSEHIGFSYETIINTVSNFCNSIGERISLLTGNHKGIKEYIYLANFLESSSIEEFDEYYEPFLHLYSIEDIKILFHHILGILKYLDFQSDEMSHKFIKTIRYMQDQFGLSLHEIFLSEPILIFQTDTKIEDLDLKQRYDYYSQVSGTVNFLKGVELDNPQGINFLLEGEQVLELGKKYGIIVNENGDPEITVQKHKIKVDFSHKLTGFLGDEGAIKVQYVMLGLLDTILDAYKNDRETERLISAVGTNDNSIDHYSLTEGALKNFEVFCRVLGEKFQASDLVLNTIEHFKYHECDIISEGINNIMTGHQEVSNTEIVTTGPSTPRVVIDNTN